MNKIRIGGDKLPLKYTINIDPIADMFGYAVEIIDKEYYQNYTLSGVYPDRVLAIKEADTFINNLFEEEHTLFIN